MGKDRRKRTTIQIEKDTLKELKTFKIVRRETYDEVIARFMKNEKEKRSKPLTQ